MKLLSSLNRAGILDRLKNESFDLTIIGGGITGAGIALDAASRGLKVALVEKEDFAAGTSSKSTKLIHGGLRYLKQFEIGLVREVGHERAIVHRLAPHLVLAEKMLLPLIEDGTYGKMATSVGLWVYDVLAGVESEDKRVMLSKIETLEKEPLLREDILVGGGYYAEYRTDDARLTIENIKTAINHGAVCSNYTRVQDFIYNNHGQITGVQCRDVNADTVFNISTRYVISAAGPWVDKLRKTDNSLEGKHLFLSKGVHIVVPHDRLPVQQSVYFDNSDGRMIFAIPRNCVTYIGTTDTAYHGDLNHIPIHLEDVNYLLSAANLMFPGVNLRTEDVESSWAGLRPLIHEEGKSGTEMSRKDEIFESKTGLISIAGGKLTGYRKMAERVVNRVADKYRQEQGISIKKCFTDTISLSGGLFVDAAEVETYLHTIQERVQSLKLPSYRAKYLVTNYGRQSELILDNMTRHQQAPEIALVRAEAAFAIRHELALSLLDFFNRRSGRLYFDLPSILPALKPVADDFSEILNWDEQKKEKEIAQVKAAIRHVTKFEYSVQEELGE